MNSIAIVSLKSFFSSNCLFRFFKIFFIFSFFANSAFSQNTKVYGKVVDEITKEPVPFVNVFFNKTNIGTTTDINGKYLLETSIKEVDSISFTFVGYEKLSKAIQRGKTQDMNVQLKTGSVSLNEVVIKPGENPAHEVLRKIIANKKINDKEKLQSYNYEVYNKIQFDINNIDEGFKNRKALKPFQFIFDFIDSTAEKKPFLPLFISETVSDVYYDKKFKKEIIKATQISGVDNESINQFLGDIYLSVNIYDNNINIFGKSFVSPISDFGLIYYKYYLIDSAFIDNRWSKKLSFMPKRRQELTFAGELWVDSETYGVNRIEVSIASDANLNFINGFRASQSYTLVDSSVWMLDKETVFMDFNIGDKTMGVYGRKTSSYQNIKINESPPANIVMSGQNVEVLEKANKVDKKEWVELRHDSLTKQEKEISLMIDSIKDVPVFRTYYDVINTIMTGYKVLEKIELGPYFTTFSYNRVEGPRLRLGGRTSNAFSTNLMLEGYGAYGFLDERFKYGGGFMYFLGKTPRRHFIKGFYKDDVEQLGESPNALRQDNILSSAFRRRPFYKLNYVQEAKLTYEMEWFEGFSNNITLVNRHVFPTDSVIFQRTIFDGDVYPQSRVSSTELRLGLRFAYKEKFLYGEFERISLGTRYPIVNVDYTLGIKGILGGMYDYNKLKISLQNYVNTPPFGYTKYFFEAGKIWGNLPYPLLKLHNGNETYSYDYYAFNMMNLFEFASDRYVSFSVVQHFEGFFLNKIPLMRKLKWREVALFKGVAGDLRNNHINLMDFPLGLQSLDKPYYETGVGIENIFKILRIDALWRLSYRDNPNIQTFGIRGAVQFKF